MRRSSSRRLTPLHTTTFRIAVLYLALFGISVIALLAFVYWATAGFMARQIDETIGAEITGLAEQYRRDGFVRLAQVVLERSQNQRQSLYLLASPNRRAIGGNLESWPVAEAGEDGWFDFVYERPMGGETELRKARGRQFTLPGGFHLVVARDVSERLELVRLLRGAMGWSLALTIGLGLLGGLLISRNMLARIEAINRTSRDIMAGDLSQRIPMGGSRDELDRLAENLNAMLDQIDALMTGMRQVTDNIAHDLRSPLTRIRSRLELSLLSAPSAETYRAALEQTLQETERLIVTFNALLSIAQVEAGSLSGSMGEIDLASIAEDVAELYTPVAEDAQLVLAVETEPALLVRGNRHLLSQAIANLVDNAIKHTPPSGTVTISARPSADGEAVLSVADTGPGIPETERQRVLDRFVRLESSRHTPGSGLGLSLVRAVAQLHHAALSLADGDPGLVVHIRFPRTMNGNPIQRFA